MSKKCKSCKQEIDKKASKCPYCQADQRNWFMRHKLVTIIITIFIISIAASNPSNTNNSKSSAPAATIISQAEKDDLAKIFCSERSQPYVRAVNFTDFILMIEKAPEEVSLNPANGVYPTEENCRKITNLCLKLWKKQECRNIAERKIWIGMEKNQLILSWGLPRDRNNTTMAWGISSQWVYGDFKPYVYLRGESDNNLKVTSWQD